MDTRTARCAIVFILMLAAGISSCRDGFPGTITPIRGDIGARLITITVGTSGEVTRITRGPGDPVKIDELLMRLDPTDSEGDLSRARERLSEAVDEEKKAKEELDRTTAEIAYSGSRYQTFLYLLKRGAVARREVDRLRDEWEFAREQHEKAVSWHDRAAGNLEQAEADLAKTEAEYGAVLVLCPADGYMTRLMTWEGGYLLKGEEAIVIAEEGEVYFTGKTDDGRSIRLGEDAVILPLGLPTGIIEGYVSAITDVPFGKRLVTVRLFPKSKKDIVNIGSRAWGVIYRDR